MATAKEIMFTEDPLDFLQEVKKVMKWDSLAGLTIMDVGCGTGQNSSKRLLETFPEIEKLIGIDASFVAIDQARQLNSHPKAEYWIADIRNNSTLEKWKGSISRLFSYYCCSSVRCQRQAFENIGRLLGPCGEAALLFTVRSDHYVWFQDLVAKWKKYLGDDVVSALPESQARNYTPRTYTEMLEEIGFTVLYCEEEYKSTEFKSDEDLRTHLKNFLHFLTDRIPSGVAEVFYEYAFESYVQTTPKNEKGRWHTSHTVVKIMMKKKFYV